MNRMKSKVRGRIEHIFGAMKSRCRDKVLRTIGFARARFWIGLRNLAYNMGRLVSLKCPKIRYRVCRRLGFGRWRGKVVVGWGQENSEKIARKRLIKLFYNDKMRFIEVHYRLLFLFPWGQKMTNDILPVKTHFDRYGKHTRTQRIVPITSTYFH